MALLPPPHPSPPQLQKMQRKKCAHVHHHPPKYKAVSDAAAECVLDGNNCLRHCFGMLSMDDTSMADCTKASYDVIAACGALEVLASTNSPHAPAFAKAVAEVCEACKKECDKFPAIFRVRRDGRRVQDLRGRMPQDRGLKIRPHCYGVRAAVAAVLITQSKTLPPASSQALSDSLNTQPWPLQAFIPLQAFLGVWQSDLPLQLFAPKAMGSLPLSRRRLA